MNLFKIITSIILLIVITGVSVADEPQQNPPKSELSVAVHTLEAHGISEDEAATLTDVLRSKLMNTGKYEVMERSQMEAILEEQAFRYSGSCTDKECMVEMGQILGIQQIIAGSIGMLGKTYSINVRIISVETGKILNSVTHNYTGPFENLLTTEMSVVANRLADVEIVYKPRTPQKRVRDNKKRKRNFLITSLSLVALGVGVIAYFLIRED